MAIPGPAPKAAGRRARANKDPIPQTILRHEKVQPPKLPAEFDDYPYVLQWWDTWVRSPQADTFGSTDWQVLLETAFLVRAFYDGEYRLGAEIRQRVAKFGATPEDRARLRMQFAQADEADAKRPATKPVEAKDRLEHLYALPSAVPEAR